MTLEEKVKKSKKALGKPCVFGWWGTSETGSPFSSCLLEKSFSPILFSFFGVECSFSLVVFLGALKSFMKNDDVLG